MNDNNPLTIGATVSNHLKQLYNEEARTHYRYSDADSLLDNLEDVLKMVKHHITYQVPRLKILQYYYDGKNVGILTRKPRSNPEKADHRDPSGYAKYIIDYNAGRIAGEGVNIEHEDDDINQSLKMFNRENDVDTFNMDIATSISIYGRAYEIQYRRKDDIDVVRELSVFNTFMVYDTTIEHDEVASVYYIQQGDNYDIQIHTEDEVVIVKTSTKEQDVLYISERTAHDYGEVNVIEYVGSNNREGDAEPAIPTIDTYDYAIADLANYMTDINQSKLIISGAVDPSILEADEKDVARDNRDSDILIIPAPIDKDGKPTGTANVQRITREYDAVGTREYLQRLDNDIHKFSAVPNFDDTFFASTSSGVAILYKLLQSDIRLKKKKRYFEKGLRKRYRLLANMKKSQEELKNYDQRGLKITIQNNLPISFRDEIETYINAGGQLSQKTLLEQMSFVSNVEEEIRRLAEEQANRRDELNLTPDWLKLEEKTKELLDELDKEESDI